MNQKIAELYQTNNVNPLAGCIPSLVQIPVFIGLYRAVLDLATENALDESFLWLPSLEGPTYGTDPSKGSAWLFDNWVNGAPSLGWEQTAAFLVLPIFLVISQFASMEIMTPKEQKETQPAFLKVLPLMIGYFSLNVPSALCVYWVTNNIVTTATSVIIRNSLKMDTATVAVSSESTPAAAANPNVFTPPTIREKPEGFGSSTGPSSAGVTPITNAEVVDAEVVSEIVSNSEEVVDVQATKKVSFHKKAFCSSNSVYIVPYFFLLLTILYFCYSVEATRKRRREERTKKSENKKHRQERNNLTRFSEQYNLLLEHHEISLFT